MTGSYTEPKSIVNTSHISEDNMSWTHTLENCTDCFILVSDNSATFETVFSLF